MTKQEEQLWNYIDGYCNAAEEAEIAAKLKIDRDFELLYQQLLEVNKQLSIHVEVDEPSMSFTRNVMAQVQHEIPPVALKTKVDQRIIYAIGAFFAITLLAILVYAFATADFKMKMSAVDFTVNIDALISPAVLMVFLLINAALLLIYLDSYLRKGIKKAGKK